MKFFLFAVSILCIKILTPPVLLSTSVVKLYHEGPIYDPELGIVLISSEIIERIDRERPVSASTVLDLGSGNLTSFNTSFTKIPYANGGIRTSKGKYIICGQGDIDRKAGLYILDPHTMESKPLLTSYQNLNFNSPNDIVLHGDTVYFTDPDYGYKQGFRPKPQIPAGVYRARFDSEREILTGLERILGSHVFDKPNGIAVSRDGQTLLVTDSGYFVGTGEKDLNRPRDIYMWNTKELNMPGKIIFRTEMGVPDGIKFDSQNRLWVGNYGGDGILQVDHITGEVKAKISIKGGSANFAFVRADCGREEMVIMGDYNLWRHSLT